MERHEPIKFKPKWKNNANNKDEKQMYQLNVSHPIIPDFFSSLSLNTPVTSRKDRGWVSKFPLSKLEKQNETIHKKWKSTPLQHPIKESTYTM